MHLDENYLFSQNVEIPTGKGGGVEFLSWNVRGVDNGKREGGLVRGESILT